MCLLDESDDADEIIDFGAGQADTNEYPNADDEFEDDGFEVLHQETNIQSDEGAPIDDEGTGKASAGSYDSFLKSNVSKLTND